jgi:hypothetical protein
MTTDFLIKFFIVFISMLATDIAWTIYFIKVEERKVIASGIWSSLIMVGGTLVTTSYVGDNRLIAAAVLGAFVGTAGTVYYKKKKP